MARRQGVLYLFIAAGAKFPKFFRFERTNRPSQAPVLSGGQRDPRFSRTLGGGKQRCQVALGTLVDFF